MSHQIIIDTEMLSEKQLKSLYDFLYGKEESTNAKLDKKIAEEAAKNKTETKKKRGRKSKSTKKTIAKKEINTLLKHYRDEFGLPDTKALMKKFNAKTVADINEDDYEEIALEINKALAEAESNEETEVDDDDDFFED